MTDAPDGWQIDPPGSQAVPPHSPLSQRFQRLVAITSTVPLSFPVVLGLIFLFGTRAETVDLLCPGLFCTCLVWLISCISMESLNFAINFGNRAGAVLTRIFNLLLAVLLFLLHGSLTLAILNSYRSWISLIILATWINSLGLLIGWLGFIITTRLPGPRRLDKIHFETGIDDTQRGGDWDEAKKPDPHPPQ